MNRKGVLYDAGRVLGGNWRPDYRPDLVRRELRVIAEDLHCTAVKICGRDLGRLVPAAEAAAGLGLEVWLCPELWDRPPAQTAAHLEAAAAAAETLRRRWPDRIVLSVGTELSLFMPGILPGRTFPERVRRLQAAPRGVRRDTPLREYLNQTTDRVRRVFHGPITYASLPFEQVDWARFDIVGVDLYWHERVADRYPETLRRWLAHDRPAVVSEFGFRTFTGADLLGPAADINLSAPSYLASRLPLLGRLVRPRVRTVLPRDEPLQAAALLRQLAAIDASGADGGFIHTFTFPIQVHGDDPRHDLDIDSFALVKTLPRGRRGTAYPDLPWEPKQSFHAVADYYAGH